jgi:hypothetical protein
LVVARDDLTLARMLLDRDDLDLDPEPLFLAANRKRAGHRAQRLSPKFGERRNRSALRADGALVENWKPLHNAMIKAMAASPPERSSAERIGRARSSSIILGGARSGA